jgi:hypothetical protein
VKVEQASREDVVRIGAVARGTCCIGWRGLCWLAVLANRLFPRVFAVCHALVDNRLKCGWGQRVATKAKSLNHSVVLGQKGPEHEPDLQHWVDYDAPQFERCKKAWEPSSQSDNGFVQGLFDVNEVKNVTKWVHGARWVKMLIKMVDHLEAFPIELRFLNKQVGDRGLNIVI